MKLLLILLFTLLIRLPLLSANQQDLYLNYAQALKQNNLNQTTFFPPSETRLFPGYPLLILLFNLITPSLLSAGHLINILSAIAAVFLFYRLTENYHLTFLFSLFPPVWLRQSTNISTEPLTVVLLLLALWLNSRRHYFAVGLIIGLATTVRLIAVCLLFGLIMVHTNKKQHLFKIIFGFLIPLGFFFSFNYFTFGPEGVFRQIAIYPKVGGAGGFSHLGIITIVKDIFRAFDWKQYRILISGLFYLTLNFFTLISLFRLRLKKQLFRIAFFWQLSSLGFIFSFSPIPLLEEFGRFTVPFVPAIILGLQTIKLRS